MMAMVRPSVVGDSILANRRVDADWQRYQEPDHDCHETKLNGYRQSIYYPLLYRPTAHAVILQGCPEGDPLKWDSPVTQSGVGNTPIQRPYCT